MKKFMIQFSGIAAALLLFVAKVSPFCLFGHYQPEVPESLRK